MKVKFDKLAKDNQEHSDKFDKLAKDNQEMKVLLEKILSQMITIPKIKSTSA